MGRPAMLWLLVLWSSPQAMEVHLPEPGDGYAALPEHASTLPPRAETFGALDSVPGSGRELMQRGEVGFASFYSHEFKGRPTASGHRFDPLAPTAAHKTLPLGTAVRITNLENGRSATATINDRGPYVQGRVVDVSLALARQLGFVQAGMARVKVEIMGWEPVRRLRDAVTAMQNRPQKRPPGR
ncbi:MAG: septal ring lytic transglycosylase RlpA family protein [Betaproteobacteria bacterium]